GELLLCEQLMDAVGEVHHVFLVPGLHVQRGHGRYSSSFTSSSLGSSSTAGVSVSSGVGCGAGSTALTGRDSPRPNFFAGNGAPTRFASIFFTRSIINQASR